MDRVRLFYKDISEIVGGEGFSVVRLTDEFEQRALCVICDKLITEQLTLRINGVPGQQRMLPEVLSAMILSEGANDLELNIHNICDGQYIVSLLNKRSMMMKPIKMSDAVLLHIIAKTPIYIVSQLMDCQSMPYTPDAKGLSIPINSLDTVRLNKELERAIEEENYRLASHLHEELQKRRQ
jgi:bifunctional DNase/RNase